MYKKLIEKLKSVLIHVIFSIFKGNRCPIEACRSLCFYLLISPLAQYMTLAGERLKCSSPAMNSM